MKPKVSEVIALLQENHLLTEQSLGGLSGDRELLDITFDNRTATEGSLFICKGAAFKVEYLLSAFEKGAVLYVAETPFCDSLPYLLVSDIRLAMSRLAAFFFAEDAKDVIKVGITGTKGKTTVALFLNAILDSYCAKQYSKKSGLLSSLYIYDGRDRLPAKLTTPEAIELWHHLSIMGENALPFATCEVSSQALKYHRVGDVLFEIALFLNIGNDHISEVEHPDFEDYFASKLSLFEHAKIACINSESEKIDEILAAAKKASCQVTTFGFSVNDTLYCSQFERIGNAVELTVSYQNELSETYTLLLFGKHNVENALAAILCAKLLCVDRDAIYQGLLHATVEGRGEELSTDDGRVRVIVDYAHNGMSLEALYRYCESAYPDYRVITLFGCPGGKAKNRREDMGRLAAKHSDLVILTEDDPANEPLSDIFAEIAYYLDRENTPYLTVDDRGQAIATAFEKCFDKTVILLCGKGAEKAQKRGTCAVFYEGDSYFAKEQIAAYNRNILPVG